MTRTILHINPDDFHASVLRVKDPSLRGRALLIAEPHPRSRVLACSYEARSEGVRRGQRVEEARRLCPRGLWVFPESKLFQKVSWKILRFLSRNAPRVEAGLSGEAFLDVTGCRALLGPPEDLAQKLRRDIRSKFCVEASAGVATNKLVSLGASIEAKKAGMVDVFSGYEAAFFEPWPIHLFPGVSESLALKFQERSVGTAGDLAKLPPEWPEAWLGPPGRTLWTRARGQDSDPVRGLEHRDRIRQARVFGAVPSPERNSSLRSETGRGELAPERARWRAGSALGGEGGSHEILDRELILAHSAELASDMGRTLRRKILRARRLSLFITYADGRILEGTSALAKATDSDLPLIFAARSLFLRVDLKRMRVSALALEASCLEPGEVQGELWSSVNSPSPFLLRQAQDGEQGRTALPRERVLSETRDAIRRRFKDPKAIFWGSAISLHPPKNP